jgi:isocitrate dehydrogenase
MILLIYHKLEAASIKTIENGIMTKDLAQISTLPDKKIVNTEQFLVEVRNTLDKML